MSAHAARRGMQWTGNVARTVGQILLAVGIIACTLGILGLLLGGLIVKDAASDPRARNGDVGEVVEFLVVGGLGFTVAGTVAIVASLVVLGVARSLRERLMRRMVAVPAATSVPVSPDAKA
jgi:hypothetical protein